MKGLIKKIGRGMLELSLMKLLDGMELLFAVSKDTPR